jgi:hypothetical protein
MGNQRALAVVNAATESPEKLASSQFDTFAKRVTWCQHHDSNSEFARRLGVSTSTVRRWKRRAVAPGPLRMNQAEVFANRIGVDWSWLFTDVGYPIITPDGELVGDAR